MQNIILTLNETDDTLNETDDTMNEKDLNFFYANNDNDENTTNGENTTNDDIYDIVNLTLFYNINYTLKGIVQIMQYYDIYKGKNKLLKTELIQMLLFYETDPANKVIVEKRLRLWSNIQELKQDAYFSKYISFTPFNI